jgi:hypothetical protein
MKLEHLPLAWMGNLVGPKQRKMDMEFGTWNLSSLYRSGSLTAATRELARYKLDLVDMREVRWGKRGHSKRRGFLRNTKRNSLIGNRIFYTQQLRQ